MTLQTPRGPLGQEIDRMDGQRELLLAYIARDLGQSALDLQSLGFGVAARQIDAIAKDVAPDDYRRI